MNNENAESVLEDGIESSARVFELDSLSECELIEEELDLSESDGDSDFSPSPQGTPEKSSETEDVPEEITDRVEALCQRQSVDAEYLEFARLFPGVSVAGLPDAVCDSVRSGVPLAAAYALYEKQRSFELDSANERNSKNASLSFRLKENGAEKYFSPDEVKSMSREEVRTNYNRIIESMRHWR